MVVKPLGKANCMSVVISPFAGEHYLDYLSVKSVSDMNRVFCFLEMDLSYCWSSRFGVWVVKTFILERRDNSYHN